MSTETKQAQEAIEHYEKTEWMYAACMAPKALCALSIDTILTAAVSDEQADLSQQAEGSMWDDMRGDAISYVAADGWDAYGWLNHVRVFEDEYMTYAYDTIPAAKKKDGSWKYREFNYVDTAGNDQKGGLPMKWHSAKSVLKNALDRQAVFDSTTGKTQLEKENQAHKKGQDTPTPKTEEEKFKIVMETARKIWQKCQATDNDEKSDAYGIDFSNDYWRI